MNKLTLWALLGASLALGACTDPGTDPSDDTDTLDSMMDDTDPMDDTDETDVEDTDDTDPGVAPFFKAWDVDWKEALDNQCANPKGMFTLTLETVNWGYTASWYVAETRYTKDYDEEHTFEETNGPGPDSWTIFSRTLETDTYPNTPDLTSAFDCDATEQDLNPEDENWQATFAAVVYDAEGAIADCIVFGRDPATLLGTPPAGLTPPAWLTAANCRNAN